MQLSEEEWKQKLSPERYAVLRQKGTETPFSGAYEHKPDEDGTYVCGACGAVLFTTDTQYDSTIPGLLGWPSFADVAQSGSVTLVPDSSLGMSRTEVICSNCGSHLGHLFDDETSPTGQHYCINSIALDFASKDKKA